MSIKMMILITGMLTLTACASEKGEWRQPAGPNGDWTQTEGSYISNWSVRNDENILWRADLEEGGQSGLAIDGDKIFLTMIKPIKKDAKRSDLMVKDIVALCLDKKDGRVLWQHELKGSLASESMYGFSDSSTPGPVCDGERVIFTNASGGMVCYDYHGKLQWQRSWQPIERLNGVRFPFNKQFEPIISGDFVLNMEPATAKHSGRKLGWNYIFALDKRTGAVRWISEVALTHYNTPALTKDTQGKPALLIARGGHHGVPETPRGYSMISLKDGKSIWQYQPKQGMALYNSISHAGRSVWFTYNNEIHVLDSLSGKLLRKINLAKNISLCTYDDASKKMKVEHNKTLKGITVFPAWFSNIIVGDQLYFMCFKKGRYNQKAGPDYCFARVDLVNGAVSLLEVPVDFEQQADGSRKFIWRQNLKGSTLNNRGINTAHDPRSTRDGWHWNFNANPVAADGKVYFNLMRGMTYCFDTNAREWNEKALLSLNDLGASGKTWSLTTPALDHQRIYLRTLKEIICVGKK